MSDDVPEGRTLPGAVPGATTGDTPGTGDPVHGRGLLLAQEIIEAYGGIARWNRLGSLRAEIAFAGFGFRVKFVRHLPFRGTMVVERAGQRVTFEPYPVPGQRGVFEGSEVRIEAADGRVLSRRRQPRAAFRDFRHRLWWDSLDLLYFAGYAGWTYFCVPFVLIDPAYELEDAGTWQEREHTWRKLKVTFPPHIHTHCRQQVFYADNRGLIRRHDYTAEPFGESIRAAHYQSDPREFGGLVVQTRRRVHPRKANGRPRPHPILIWIDVADVVTTPDNH